MDLIEKALALREGGQTQRCHTMQFTGAYNVAVHSYNALSLLLLLYPSGQPSLNLIKAVQWHDVPERWTGDVPAPAKWASKGLKNILDSLELKVLKKLEIDEIFEDLTEEEQEWLTGVDLLELFIWCHEQMNIGNRAAEQMTPRVALLIFKKSPKEVQDFVANFKWGRTVELHDLLYLGEYNDESK